MSDRALSHRLSTLSRRALHLGYACASSSTHEMSAQDIASIGMEARDSNRVGRLLNLSRAEERPPIFPDANRSSDQPGIKISSDEGKPAISPALDNGGSVPRQVGETINRRHVPAAQFTFPTELDRQGDHRLNCGNAELNCGGSKIKRSAVSGSQIHIKPSDVSANAPEATPFISGAQAQASGAGERVDAIKIAAPLADKSEPLCTGENSQRTSMGQAPVEVAITSSDFISEPPHFDDFEGRE